MKQFAVAMVLALAGTVGLAQEVPLPQNPNETLREWNERISDAGRVRDEAQQRWQEYRIGPEDLIEISVFEVEELSRTVRVSASGEISLPLLGPVKVGGLSPMQLEQKLTQLLRGSYLNDPQVTVFLREYKSDPVSVMGAVKLPGLYQIQTRKSLIEVLAMAQGFSEGPQRMPGRSILITRKAPSGETMEGNPAQPAPSEPSSSGEAQPQGAAAAEIVEIPIKELVQTGDPKWNVPIYPGDVIKVVPAGAIYVAGDVAHPGAFPLTDFDYMSTVQALAMAGGTTKTASPKKAVIIRRDAAGNREEQPVNLNEILKGKDQDVMLGANDILFVPGSVGKTAALRAIEASIQVATGLIILGR